MLALITATRNSMATLPSMLESLAEVTGEVKSVFVDGGSTDGTLAHLASYASNQRSAVVLEQDGTGLYEALNQGTKHALLDAGVTHVGLLHSDDKLLVDNYNDYWSYIRQHAADVYYADIEYHDPAGRVVRQWESGRFSRFGLNTGWMPPHTSVIVSRQTCIDVGDYDPAFGTAADYHWLVRVLLNANRQVEYFPECVLSMRTGGASNVSLRARLRANRQDGRVWRERSLVQAAAVRVLKPLRKLGQFVPGRRT